ncbi:MAG TPA: hypothetical protein VFH90_10235 [Candidatus Limnocylindria bacterium]|nr:hypothetical protein [Candidatus Limnocylindria bacterium]
MGETLAETRVEVEAQRADNQRTATELEARVRRALDFKARFKENPALFIGLGVGAAFLVVGGPGRVARALRRRMNPTGAEQAYDALPKPMQAWVDTLAGEVGPRAGRAREALIEELQRWRQEPLKNKKARKELAKAMVEGPPGPSRTAWKAAEAALTLLSAAMARKAIEAFITGEKPTGPAKALRVAPPTPATAAVEYSGMSDKRS